MDKTIIDNINDMVEEHDILWHLGDFAFAKEHEYIRKCEQYRYRIRCQNVNMIWGNHDEPHLISHLFYEKHRLHDIYLGRRIFLCHTAFCVWEDSHRGSWNLYGHSHTSAEEWMDTHMPGRRSIDVGVDNAYRLFGSYRPFSMDDLESLLGNRAGFSTDHHIPKNSIAPREGESL